MPTATSRLPTIGPRPLSTLKMLKTLKRRTLNAAHGAGVLSIARDSSWRARRLLILGYHGVAIEDEHEWDGELYIPATLLRKRFDMLRAGGYTVLPLGEALLRLSDGTLPRRSVALTFDDGAYDFVARAYPLLEEFGYPATVYLTSYYCMYQRPVFNTMLRYLLWKARGRTLDTTGLTDTDIPLELASDAERAAAFVELGRACAARQLSGQQKDAVLTTIAERLGIDYDSLLQRRVLHLMSPDEVGRLRGDLIDVQLHTHRHRVPTESDAFEREIVENRRAIAQMTDAPPATHFCYPSGVTHPAFPGWLKRLGVASAATCFPGIASHRSDLLMLPRFIDTLYVTDVEFEGWLSGASAFLPRRPVRANAPI